MTGDTYLLISSDGYAMARFVVNDKGSHYVDGTCYTPISWYSDKTISEEYFFADVYCKWDGCTHWYFEGEDYNPESQSEDDTCYHICGGHTFNNHIRTMCFIWQVVTDIMDPDSKENYFELEVTRKLVHTMLEGYRIEKVKRST